MLVEMEGGKQSCLLSAIEGFDLSADAAPLLWPPTNKWEMVPTWK